MSLEGPLYAASHGYYKKTNSTCSGFPIFKKFEKPDRYLQYSHGQWIVSPKICVGGYFVRGPHGLTPFGKWNGKNIECHGEFIT